MLIWNDELDMTVSWETRKLKSEFKISPFQWFFKIELWEKKPTFINKNEGGKLLQEFKSDKHLTIEFMHFNNKNVLFRLNLHFDNLYFHSNYLCLDVSCEFLVSMFL